MSTATHTPQLLRILIGVAWIDGAVQSEERQYLHQLAARYHLEQHPMVRPLLKELVAVNPEQCYQWIRDYLGDTPTPQDCEALIEAISGLIYSDGEVAAEEATLLNRLQNLQPTSTNGHHLHSQVIRALRRLYQGWLQQQP
ncbi:hypothetical protein XM38_003240 [Halomicronema hongdechloris C2206]|uniref:Co-chaperone DjlA N-terminal domain-containing protein n=1 Tax=Halomicronema hongdechloris C2206 TaxID=1641165 RepID=A0A1Z3HGS5_9CYAN|nr:TerB family tellurite resistance protein [Halomicronema hongdechloris]ASC69397.1 hypothetical protein XM38_003240 [Halomicronema hongdechloris C2206]